MTQSAVKDLTIGYSATCYGMRRLSHDLPIAAHGVKYRRVRRIPWHRLPSAAAYLSNRYDYFPAPRVDAMHFFNGICVAKVPWITSVEIEYPRYFGVVPQRAFDEATERITSTDCKLIMPLSWAAREHFLKRQDPTIRENVATKTVVFTGGVSIPPEALNVRERRRHSSGEEFIVGFVGRDYWRKGGPAVVAAVAQLRRDGANVRLLIVSSIEGASYIAPQDANEVRRTRAELAAVPWIDLHENLSNDQVLSKMAACDAFAFPTLDESLGWVSIEAMGLGLPVVCSNVFALPEVVEDGVTGLTIELPLDKDRRWRGIESLNPTPRPSFEDAIDQLTKGMVAAFARLIDSPELCSRLGQAARGRFLERYEQHVAAARLASLLGTALL